MFIRGLFIGFQKNSYLNRWLSLKFYSLPRAINIYFVEFANVDFKFDVRISVRYDYDNS